MTSLTRIMYVAALVFCLSVPAMAAEKAAPPVKDVPKNVEVHATAVFVEHDGEDTAGTRLAFQLKELCNSSSLFVLTDKDTPKISILLTTVPEFPSRPEIGSAYAVVWVFAESKGNLQYFLGREAGVVSEANAAAVAQKIAERTDGFAVKYGYLFTR